MRCPVRPAKEVMKHNLHLAGRVDPSSKKQLSFPIKRNFLLTGLDIGQASPETCAVGVKG